MSSQFPHEPPPPSYDESMAASRLQPQPYQPNAPSPSEMDDLRIWFGAVDEDGNGHITAQELQQALIDEDGKPFSLETCFMLVRMFDDNSNSEIEFEEFVQLYNFVRKWRGVFVDFDDDNSGTIELEELKEAMRMIYQPHNFSEHFCKFLMRRFNRRRREGSLTLDEFIAANATVSRLKEEHDRLGASESLDSFVQRNMRN